MKKIDGMTMNEWVQHETRKHKTKFWGTSYFIKAVIHPGIFGDGLRLAFLGTIDQRPHYWLIRVDSRLDMTADDFDYEKHLLCPLEEEFGRFPEQGYMDAREFRELKKKKDYTIDEFDNYKEYISECKYPRLSWNGGHWGTVVNFGKQNKG